ncbi:helix-turn-helix domain-containing protein [Listeria monocytogenes]|uniref:helix-turn-helix domain-containing protein n=1 Tax=Listeria monocytogenes TaxID=1639 RepID=UPI000F26A4FC|nr:helix-turn-helix domain-containing protein [Listeria monocytogenes]EAC7104623.1 helix-turn-helix domain-containing protein [Listeria monocytogenes]EAC9044488.1 helix-turn-helix domain-containing protein [Listeria monocytogenes]EAC9724659.1 helix-turn-helix domain-containing protein [Listeria monocytogenes]EAD8348969.1 helix-turn-helix domain-containing protein [Listeria monocytogenes]EAD8394910.1 helix-turn-helix domain-containing protein [Listeria monocytogenes]
MSLKKILESNESIEKKEQQIDAYYQSELITRVEACELLDVSTKSLDRYIKQNKLPAFINKNRNILLKKTAVLAIKPEVDKMKEIFNK